MLPVLPQCLCLKLEFFNAYQYTTSAVGIIEDFTFHCFTPELTQARFQTFLPFLAVSVSHILVNLPQTTAPNSEEAGLYVDPFCL